MGVFGAAAVGAVGAVGAAAISSGKGSGGSTNQNSSTSPWAPQGQQIKDIYGQARSIYDTNTAAGPYKGDFVNGGNATQQGAIDQATGWTGGTGGQLPGQIAGTAGGLMGASGDYVNNAQKLASTGIAGPNAGLYGTLQGYGTGQLTTQGANPGLSTALNSAAVNGANSLQGFQNGMSDVQQRALEDPTQQTMANAQTYANSPQTQASINSVNAQIGQTLNEQTVPGLNRQAAMGGSLNSSRAGMAEGMANENAAIAMGNADAQIQNNAFNTGLTTAAAQHQAGLTTSLNAANAGYSGASTNATAQGALQQALGEFNTSTQLGAANSGLSNNLAYSNANAQTQLGANAQLGSATGLGLQGAAAAGSAASQNFALSAGAGALQQSNDNAGLSNDYQKWLMGNQYQQNLLNSWNGIVSAQNWGGDTVGTGSSTLPPNYAGMAAGGAAAGAGLYQKYGSSSSPSDSSSYKYDPSNYGYNGDANSTGGQALQSAGLYNPLPQNW